MGARGDRRRRNVPHVPDRGAGDLHRLEPPRHILHLTSKDLLHWKPLENANLESDRTIDACVFRLPDGNWRLWYKNEADSSKVYFSDSPDLVHWTPKGIATANHGEGPVVFQWKGPTG